MLLSTFVEWWNTENSRDEIIKDHVDIIVPISFTTLRDKLTDGTMANLERAIGCRNTWFPKARIVFSSCSYPFHGAEKVEDRLRAKICREAGIEPIVSASMVNTVDEAMNIRDELNARDIHPKCILIVTGEIHSRSARYIYERVFPDSLILITCIPCCLEIQPDQIVLSQRTMKQWVISNIARQIALRILPLGVVRKIKRKAAV